MKKTKNTKNARYEIRLPQQLKDQLEDLAKDNGLNLAQYTRNKLTSLVNRQDLINEISEEYRAKEEELELFLESEDIEDLGKNDKDEIIYHCDNCRGNVHRVKFTRKSNKFQSSFDVLSFGRGLLNCGEVLYLANGSSSFYDTAFLRALEFAYDNNISLIEVIALTRSEYETITRSVLIADKVVKSASDKHISLVGLDVMMLRIACVMYQNAQIRRMNTTYSYKTTLFWIYLHYGREKAKQYYNLKAGQGYNYFNQRRFELYEREYRALYELNNLNRDKFSFALKYLISSRCAPNEKCTKKNPCSWC